MARITVEDCLEKVDNRFNLVRLASLRARDLERNRVDPTVPRKNHKSAVIALIEIAEGHISPNYVGHAVESEETGINDSSAV